MLEFNDASTRGCWTAAPFSEFPYQTQINHKLSNNGAVEGWGHSKAWKLDRDERTERSLHRVSQAPGELAGSVDDSSLKTILDCRGS